MRRPQSHASLGVAGKEERAGSRLGWAARWWWQDGGGKVVANQREWGAKGTAVEQRQGGRTEGVAQEDAKSKYE